MTKQLTKMSLEDFFDETRVKQLVEKGVPREQLSKTKNWHLYTRLIKTPSAWSADIDN